MSSRNTSRTSAKQLPAKGHGADFPHAPARAESGSEAALGTTAKSSAAFGPKNGLKSEEKQAFNLSQSPRESGPNCLKAKESDSLRSGRVVIDSETGEIATLVVDPRTSRLSIFKSEQDAKDEARFNRYALQSAARNILKGDLNPRGKPWRTVDCLCAITGSEVGVMYAPSVQRAHYSGLATCGSVWGCSVCSAKITERRKLEVEQAANLHLAAGGGLYMVTLTWAHTRHDDLAAMVEGSRQALTKLRGRRSYVKLQREIDYVGLIRAFEVKHSDANGWHPHFHELIFTAKPLTRDQIREWSASLYEMWRAQCVAAGLGEPNRKAGVSIVQATSPADYMAKFGHQPKWGVGAEMTRSQAKKGTAESRTPWDLLRLYAEGGTRFFHLFREYVSAFFGARQLYWSPGLKQSFGIDEISDEALAAREDEKSYQLCRISKEDWYLVLRQPYESRALILKLAESGGVPAIEEFLKSIRK